MPTSPLWCRECENHVSPDYPHSCYNAKQVRAVRDAEAAVVEAAEAMCGVIEQPRTDNYREYRTASDLLVAAVTALHAARQGEG